MRAAHECPKSGLQVEELLLCRGVLEQLRLLGVPAHYCREAVDNALRGMSEAIERERAQQVTVTRMSEKWLVSGDMRSGNLQFDVLEAGVRPDQLSEQVERQVHVLLRAPLPSTITYYNYVTEASQ